MNEDIVPGLLANIEDDFKKSFQSDDTLKTLYGKVQDGTATQADGEKFSHELGRLTAEVFHRNVTPEILPDGTLYYNIANRIIPPVLGNNYGIVCEVMKQVIERMNHDAGLGIKFQEPEFESGKVHDLVWKASLDKYEKTQKMVETGMDTFTRSVADDCVRTNAEFQYEAGLSPRIERDTDGDCCSWCSDMAGTYDYKSAPKEVFARHANCGCTVEFLPGDGRRQNVHTKDWTSETESAMMKAGEGGDADLSPDKLEALKMGKPKVDKNNIPLGDYAGTVSRETTKEERAMLLQYALERGVNLQGVKEFDGDIELAKSVIDTMAKWQELMPCKDRVSLGFFYRDPDLFGKTQGVGIEINSLALRDRKTTEDSINKDPLQFAEKVVEDIVVHEYAHAYANSHNIPNTDIVEIVKHAFEEIGSPGDDLIAYLAHNISKYSVDEDIPFGDEVHSEIFAKHNSAPTEFTKIVVEAIKKRGELYD